MDREQPIRAQQKNEPDEDALVQKALSFSYYYLTFRPRSEWEVRSYLGKKTGKFKLSNRVIDRAITKLKELHYLDDIEFIAWYVDYQRRVKRNGDQAIRRSLTQLGLQSHLIEQFFMEDESDPFALACEALRPKWQTYARLEQQRRFRRAAAYLQRRGYAYDIIVKVIELMEKDQ